MKNHLKSALVSLLIVAMGGALGVTIGALAGIGWLLWLGSRPDWNGDAATGLGGIILITALLGGVAGVILGGALVGARTRRD